ncbi:uncharacterized protein LOC124253070 [Haliotis rubra]|uniref:uncharacterized protein LOC124253070 n=1 Tax=Haliotis rubra TaxID=36100 RepID=UPI001EE528A4|nr:uncharacterized protein LOC124253070 [Haliotis rubra]
MDDTGFVYMDVWGDIADQIQMGRVFKINSCKKRESERSLDSWITTTPRSTVTYLPSSELKQIQKERYQRGKLMGIDVTPYMSCPTPRCFHFQLTDGLCESCQRHIQDRDQVIYGEAIIDIRTQKGNIHQLTVYWPELCKLFGLFKKDIPPGIDKEKIVQTFMDLAEKPVKYQACGIVRKFKR